MFSHNHASPPVPLPHLTPSSMPSPFLLSSWFPSCHPQTEPPVFFKAPDHILRLNDFITNYHYCVVSSRNVLLLLLLSARHSIWAVKNQFLGRDSRSRHFCAHSTTMICLLSQLTFLVPSCFQVPWLCQVDPMGTVRVCPSSMDGGEKHLADGRTIQSRMSTGDSSGNGLELEG